MTLPAKSPKPKTDDLKNQCFEELRDAEYSKKLDAIGPYLSGCMLKT